MQAAVLATDHPAGTRLGDFTIERTVGEGGMAVLYLATDSAGRRRVLKVPHRSHSADPVAIVAFENELRLAHYLADFPYSHMPVPHASDSGRYLVMDYIEGTDLWTYLRQQGCLSEAEAVALTKKIVVALSELHKRRIVHLDLKLSNVMVTPSGEIRLIDFGLANHLDFPDHIYEAFREPKGTPAYIAPEQFFGVRDEPRSDVFSIGTMLFEMTTSRLPFPEATSRLDVISRIRRQPVSPRFFRPELSEAFATVVLTCLENLPDRRYPNMDALQAALDRLADTAAIVVPCAEATAAGTAVPNAHLSLLRRAAGWLRRQGGERVDRLDEIKRWIDAHRAGRAPAPFRIVAAVDIEAGQAGLNREIVEQAMHLAHLQPAIVTLLCVLANRDTGMASGEREQELLNTAHRQARDRVVALLEGIDRRKVTVGIHVRLGDPVENIADCVKDYEADLLVIGARQRPAFTRFLLGSTTYKALTTIQCPVYVVQESVVRNAGRYRLRPARRLAGEGDPAYVVS